MLNVLKDLTGIVCTIYRLFQIPMVAHRAALISILSFTGYPGMVLSSVYVIPHGDEIISKKNAEAARLNSLISDLSSGDTSDTMVILSPHGLRISDSVAVINTEWLHGDLVISGLRLRRKYRVHRDLANQIANLMDGFTRSATFITTGGPKSVFPLDFGSLIPLSFFSPERVVAIGQPRIANREKLVEFGKLLGNALISFPGNVSVIFSADQAHTHASDGPYGYSPKAKLYEEAIRAALTETNFSYLMKMSEDTIDEAKPDSFWNMLILSGLLESTGKMMQYDFGYVEHYFGMMLAHSIPSVQS